MGAKQSAHAKSKGPQDEADMSEPDIVFLETLHQKKKVSKEGAHYATKIANRRRRGSCNKCKFNLADEGKCHIVRGQINNEKGISKYFSPKGDGMLPGDLVWKYVKETDKKLNYEEGHVIKRGAPGFQCEDCKYYMYARHCLLIKGKFKPKMSCGFIVKIGHGTDI